MEKMDRLLKTLSLGDEQDKSTLLQRGPNYTKPMAEVMNKRLIEPNVKCFLYEFSMKSRKPIPEGQTTRGQKTADPGDTTKNFGILTTQKVPPICEFSLITSSGEVWVNLELVTPDKKDILLNKKKVEGLTAFHQFTFADVLGLITPLLQFDPQNAMSKYFVVPIDISGSGLKDIDWDLINQIKKHKESPPTAVPAVKRKTYAFDAKAFNDAVVIPWYRTDKSEYFVAEVRHDLSPMSPFPEKAYPTFQKYYSGKHNTEIMNTTQPLLSGEQTSAKHHLPIGYVNLNGNSSGAALPAKKEKQNNNLLVPELCYVHPFPASFWRKAVCLPWLLFRLNSLLVAEQLRHKVAKESGIGSIDLKPGMSWPPLMLVAHRDECVGKPFIQNFDPLKSDVQKEGPGPALVLQALTLLNACDGINLERLETLGDSFLKYAVTAYLYCLLPGANEGSLTIERSAKIKNSNLCILGKKMGVVGFMNATKLVPKENWCPPCYSVSGTTSVPIVSQQTIPDYSIADCVEALVGAYLISPSGPRGALLFLKWLGLKVMSTEDYNKDTKDPIWHWLPIPKSPLVIPPVTSLGDAQNKGTAEKQLNDLYKEKNLSQFETRIGYVFRDKAYLVQAFTHSSTLNEHKNHVTQSYQRLEFLGDAVLDYLITRYFYADPASHSSGDLTSLRSALVNNEYFECLSVKYQFYTHFVKHIPNDLKQGVMAFVESLKQKKYQGNILKFLREGEDIGVECKALGDIFESVAGAIFLDSGMSLDAVWKVYYKMMKQEIEYSSLYIPRSPVQELHEKEPQTTKFGSPQVHKSSSGEVHVCLEVSGLGKFVGVGRNQEIAKRSAAKQALKARKARK